MKILLDLDGWQKETDVSTYIRSRGRVEIGMDLLPKVCRNHIKEDKIRINFIYRGNHKNNLPVFEKQYINQKGKDLWKL